MASTRLEPPIEFKNQTTACLKRPGPIKNVDWVLCTNYGYLLELSGKLITRNCLIDIQDAVNLCVFVDYSQTKRRIFYVVRSATDVLILIERTENNVEVRKRIEKIERFAFLDPDNRGYSRLFTLNGEPAEVLLEDVDVPMETEETFNPSLVEHLPGALQNLKKEFDGLSEALRLKRIFNARHLDKKGDKIEDLLPLEDDVIPWPENGPPVPPPLALTETWHRVFCEKWVCAAGVINTSDRPVSIQHLVFKGRDEFEYKWTILVENDEKYSKVKNISPGTKAVIIMATDVPDLTVTENPELIFEIHCEKTLLTLPKFSFNLTNFVNGDDDIFHPDQSALRNAQDFMALHLTHIICEFEIEYKVPASISLREMLVNDLKLCRVPDLSVYGDRVVFLRGTSRPLHGFLLRLEAIFFNRHKLVIFACDEPQLYVFLCALKKISPDGTTAEFSNIDGF